jgi:2-methylcitrate dehydratase PrpD
MIRAEVHLKDGTVLEETVEAPRGSEHSFASEAQVVEKFEKLATPTLGERQTAALRDAILGMDNLDDASVIAKALVLS